MIAENIYDVLEPMIQLLITKQEKIGPTAHEMTSYAWLKDVCTIKIAGPRGSGHSTACRNLVRRYSGPSGPRFLIVNNHHRAAEVNKSLLQDLRGGVQVVSCDSKEWIKGLTVNFNAVVFDGDGAEISRDKIEEMYHLCAAFIETGEKFFFIILG